LEADAEQACEKLNGTFMKSRQLQLDFGIKKERKKKGKNKEELLEVSPEKEMESDSEEEPDKEEAEQTEQKVGGDQKEADSSDLHVSHSRQIAVFGVPLDINKKIFKSVLQKISRKAFVELVKEDSPLTELLQIISPVGKIMLLTANSRQEANTIMDNFHNTNLNNLGFSKYQGQSSKEGDDEEDDVVQATKNQEESLKLKNRLKEKLVCRLISDISALQIRKKKCRLIIRNLSFQATLQNLVDKMNKFGPIVEVEIPTETIEKKPRNNHKKDSGEPKEMEKSEKIQKEKPKGYGFVTYLCEKDAKNAVENSKGLKICNREVAIDYCLSKSVYEKYGKDQPAGEEGAENSDEETESAGKEDIAAEDNDESESVENDDDNNGKGDEDEENNKNKPKVISDDTKEGRTIFIHGLSYDSSSNDLQEFFEQYGKIDMAIIVKDKITGISKGSAFIKFQSKDSVDRIFREIATRNKNNAALGSKDNKNNMIEFNNRNCFISLAMNKEDLTLMKSSSKFGKDKRNLYLANEGIAVSNSSDEVISKHDKEKRIQSQVDKKKKLQNPIFYISNDRLSIRNLSKKITNHELKIICLKAVKSGLTSNLVSLQDVKNFVLAQGLSNLDKLYEEKEDDDQEKEQKRPFSSQENKVVDINSLKLPEYNAKNCVKTVKIMFDENKIREGKPQSRGYAFVEFSNHIYALAALRELNNNVKYNNVSISNDDKEFKGRLIAEFTVENLKKVSCCCYLNYEFRE
jgi:RNA recognition motif-containing protein